MDISQKVRVASYIFFFYREDSPLFLPINTNKQLTETSYLNMVKNKNCIMAKKWENIFLCLFWLINQNKEGSTL